MDISDITSEEESKRLNKEILVSQISNRVKEIFISKKSDCAQREKNASKIARNLWA
jgi:hypothetical protein